jgi:hypothetical protein
MNTNQQIVELGELFKGRLDADLVDFAVDYVKHGESILALETLCDHLCEHETPITLSEHDEILRINSAFGGPLDARVIGYLSRLVVKDCDDS